MSYYKNKNVLVCGGHGFLGRHVLPRLERFGAHLYAPTRKQYDLASQRDVKALMRLEEWDIVFNLAGGVGGIGANDASPASYYLNNILTGTLLIDAAHKSGVKKFVQIGSVCAYPKIVPTPFCESDLWNGYPEDTNAPYGIAKRALLTQLQAYHKQYGFASVYPLLTNIYGPYDDFELGTSHAIPAMIRKISEANIKRHMTMQLLGTGRPTRDFLYVEDAANMILTLAEQVSEPTPINLGSGVEVSISDTAHIIAHLIGYDGGIIFDSRAPDGQPRRVLDTSKALRLGILPTVGLREGLERTIAYYRDMEAVKP